MTEQLSDAVPEKPVEDSTPESTARPGPFTEAADRLKALRKVAIGHTGLVGPPYESSELGRVDVTQTVNAGLIENLEKAEKSLRDEAARNGETPQSN